MKVINLSSKPLDKNWTKCFMDDSHYDECYSEDVTIYRPDGQPLLVLIKEGLSKSNTALAWSVLKKLHLKTMNRGSASGMATEPYVRKDGKISKTSVPRKGWVVESGIMGFFERTIRMPFCRPCSWNEKNPEKFAKIVPAAQEVSELFSKHVPDRYSVQKSYVDRTEPAYVIPGTVFSTLTINKNFRTACHKDAGDLESGFSCLSVIRQGLYTGAKLVLPNWRVAVDLGNRDVVMFDAHEWHGNTQLVQLSKDAVRCSIVHYYRENMCKCQSPAEELARAKSRKSGMKLYD